jgi:replicative DNA helicase
MIEERTLPHDIQTEKAVLGALLVGQKPLYNTVADRLQQGLFYRDAHRRILGAIVTAFEDRGEADLLILKDILSARAEFDEVGGPAYLASLTDGVPRAANVDYYIEILRQHEKARQVIHATKRALTSAFEGTDDAETVAARLQRDLESVSAGDSRDDFRHVSEIYTGTVAPDLEARMAAAGDKRPVGLSTGYPDIDKYTAGLQPKDLILIAARPSMGKTTLAMNMAEYVAKTYDLPVAVFSLEMGADQLFYRMWCAEARVNYRYVRQGIVSDAEMKRLGEAIERISTAPIYINDQSDLTAADIVGRARRLKQKHGGKLGGVFIDYVQLMHERERFANRNLEIGHISRTLKAGAKELNCPFVLLSQLSRAQDKSPMYRPQLSDLRDSGNLEQDADVVMFIWRDEREELEDHEIGVAEVIIRKQRNGPKGTAKLAFIPEFTRFDNQEL